MVDVEQVDREAAKLHQHRFLTEGRSETELLWEAFARHRIAALTAARPAILEEAAGIVLGARKVELSSFEEGWNSACYFNATAIRAAVKP